MKIAADKNQFSGNHGISNADKHIQIELLGHELVPLPLPFGDYCLITDEMQDTISRRGKRLKKADLVGDIKVSVDTKKDIGEICGNICGKTHERFRDEVILAQKCGCKFYILIENTDNILSLDDLAKWENPRAKMQKWVTTPSGERRKVLLSPHATQGARLAKACRTMTQKYGAQFLFCTPEESGKKILELLCG